MKISVCSVLDGAGLREIGGENEMTNDIITVAAIAVAVVIGAVLAVGGTRAKGGR